MMRAVTIIVVDKKNEGELRWGDRNKVNETEVRDNDGDYDM